MKKPEYNTVTIEAVKTGWIVKQQGELTEIFIRWDALVRYLEMQLTSKDDNFNTKK